MKITYPDGTDCVVQVRPSDIVRFEAHFNIPYISAWIDAQMAAENHPLPGLEDLEAMDDDEALALMRDRSNAIEAATNMTYVFFLAWSAKTKGKELPFEEWLDTFDSATLTGDEVEDVPLDPGGSSPTPPDTPLLPSTQDAA